MEDENLQFEFCNTQCFFSLLLTPLAFYLAPVIAVLKQVLTGPVFNGKKELLIPFCVEKWK